MEQAKERIIYDNWWYDYDDMRDAAIEFFLDNGYKEENITDDMIVKEIYNQLDFWWEDEDYMLAKHFEKFEYGFLVTADLGRWDGHYPGGKVLESWGEIKNACLADYDGIRIIDENGHFFIEGIHHDGTDRYEVKALTKKGFELYYECWETGDYYGSAHTEQEIHNVLYGNNIYTKLIHFAHEVYGCSKIEIA